MMNRYFAVIFLVGALIFSASVASVASGVSVASVASATSGVSGVSVNHPSVYLTKAGVAEIHGSKGEVKSFDTTMAELVESANMGIAGGILLPKPTDGGGGYSHEKHKNNYYAMYYCGLAYQLTGERQYAQFVVDMLSAYADFYPSLGYHPVELSKTPGRIFWQTLNECVWMIHTAIAYDCVYDFVPKKTRATIEKKLFRPMAEFIINGTKDNRQNNETFNKMHNHGTWATVAVAMTGFVIGDDGYVKQALYGSDLTGKNGGFMQQLNELFSPDGYFTEGAYYQRYAIWPFMMLAQAINNNMPEMEIFNYRDQILKKAVYTLLQLAYDGELMQFNDAMDKGYGAQEIVCALDVLYAADNDNKQLLSIAEKYQKQFLPTDAGYAVARDIERGLALPFDYQSLMLRDGENGDKGAFVLLRSRDAELNSVVTFKATSHGLSHGHYDKLNLVYYDNGSAVIPDYGAARFHNIEAKNKGHYTRENKSYAMSTIAHNTVAVDEESHFGGDIKISSLHNPEMYLFDTGRDGVQIVSAKETNAYKGVAMQRTVAYVETGFLQYPLILDIYKLTSDTPHIYDYPIHYSGQMISLTAPYEKSMSAMSTLGSSNGYEHLWVEAAGKVEGPMVNCFTWFENNRFYSINTALNGGAEFFMVRAGANDPDFNIRPEGGYVIRERAENHTFVSTIETHGVYNVRTEQAANLTSSVEKIEVLLDDDHYTIVRVSFTTQNVLTLCLANKSKDNERHSVSIEEGELLWSGKYSVIIN